MLSAADVAGMRAAVATTLTDTAVISRLGVAEATVPARVAPYGGSITAVPGFVPIGQPRWLVALPPFTDVRTADTLLIAGTLYVAIEILDPRTIELERLAICYSVSDVDGRRTYLDDNATISTTRRGAPNIVSARVQLNFPTLEQRVEAEGGLVAVYLYDMPGADYRGGDLIHVTELDGFTVPPPEVYVAGLVEHIGGPLPIIRVQLTTATGQF